MELYERLCKNCGGDLRETEDGRFKCAFCGSVFEREKVKDYAEEMHRLFDEFKLDAISNARKNLYEAVNAEYISSQLVHECCMELKKLLPDDPQACFYEIATGTNVKQITKAIRKLKVDGDLDIESIIRFLIRSLQTEFQLELNNLIARAFENTDPVKFEHYCTLLSAEAVKVDTGVYETKLPREVFVAYSSKDMDAVCELVETLEAQGLKCFVAARNLRHGKGAVEHYNAALEEAMDHCRSVVFVSSTSSRSFNCDALTIELPYIQKKDLENAPAEFRNNYKSIPQQYKKPRVEYRIGESASFNAADIMSNELFDGYERAYTPEEVAQRIIKQLVAAPKVEAATAPKKVKYCVSCTAECDEGAKACACGSKNFSTTLAEAMLMKQIADMQEREAAERARREQEEKERREREAAERAKRSQATSTSPSPADSGAGTSTEILLKRAFMALEDGEFDRADEFCEQVLNLDPENAKAYLGKLMSKLKIKTREYLKYAPPFDDDNNYKKIIRFGSSDLIAELQNYVNYINNRISQERLEKLYLQAKQMMKNAKSAEDYVNAAEAFMAIKDYKDSYKLHTKCINEQRRLIDIAEAERAERERQEALRQSAIEQRIAEEKALRERKKRIKRIVITCCVSIISFIIAFVILLYTVINPAIKKAKFIDTYGKDVFNKFGVVEIGTCIKYGKYEQDNNFNSTEDIEWIVLDIKDGKVLVISKYGLECQKFNKSYSSVTWETSDIRNWMNNYFLNTAFSDIEISAISTTTVNADPNPPYSTNQGNSTKDKIFLLSTKEVANYLPTDKDRQCEASDYAEAQGAYLSKAGKCWWWLRTSGSSSYYATGIYGGGGINSSKVPVNDTGGVVRPVMWIDLSKVQ